VARRSPRRFVLFAWVYAAVLVVCSVIMGVIAYHHFKNNIEGTFEDRLEGQAAILARTFDFTTLAGLVQHQVTEAEWKDPDGIVLLTHSRMKEFAKGSGVNRIVIFEFTTRRVAVDTDDITHAGVLDENLAVDSPEVKRAIERDGPESTILYERGEDPNGRIRYAKTSYAPAPLPTAADLKYLDPALLEPAKGYRFVAAVESPAAFVSKIDRLGQVVSVTVGIFSAVVVIMTLLAVGVFRRLSRRLEEQRRKAELALLSAGIAHEIKNPLAAMRLDVQLLQRGRSVPDTAAKLEREILQIDAIVRGFLDFARGAQRAAHAATSGDILEGVRLQLTEPQAACVTFGGEQGIDIFTDITALTQAVANLTANAADAALAARHDGAAAVSVTATKRGARLVIEVRDNGSGLPPSVLERLFQPFVESSKSSKGGSGLGLAIAHRLVADLKGELTLGATGSSGTVFTVSVPLRLAKKPPP
jgi:signal transduction histidine kinase